MQDDESFGWQKDVDLNGNEFYHPDVGQVAAFMELLSRGQLPELEWKSPGKRLGTSVSLHSATTSVKPAEKESSSRIFQPPNRAASASVAPVSSSPFDFDDTESLQSSFPSPFHNTASPLKIEPRKRMVGTLTNALQAVQQADKPNQSNQLNTQTQKTASVVVPTVKPNFVSETKSSSSVVPSVLSSHDAKVVVPVSGNATVLSQKPDVTTHTGSV